jgi:hypothetical protein
MGEDAGREGSCSSLATATVPVAVGDGELHDISTRQKASRTTGMRDIMVASSNLFDVSVRIWPNMSGKWGMVPVLYLLSSIAQECSGVKPFYVMFALGRLAIEPPHRNYPGLGLKARGCQGARCLARILRWPTGETTNIYLSKPDVRPGSSRSDWNSSCSQWRSYWLALMSSPWVRALRVLAAQPQAHRKGPAPATSPAPLPRRHRRWPRRAAPAPLRRSARSQTGRQP